MRQTQIDLQPTNIVHGARKRVMSLDGVNAMIAENKIKDLFYSQYEIQISQRQPKQTAVKEKTKEKSKPPAARGGARKKNSSARDTRSKSPTPSSVSPVKPAKTKTVEKGTGNRGRGGYRGKNTETKESKSRSRSLSKQVIASPKTSFNKEESKKEANSVNNNNNQKSNNSGASAPTTSNSNTQIAQNQQIFASQKLDETNLKNKNAPVNSNISNSNSAQNNQINKDAPKSNSYSYPVYNNNSKQIAPSHIQTGTVIQSSSLPNNPPIEIKIEE